MKKTKLKNRAEAAVVIAAVIAAAALVNYGSTRYFTRLDLTENRQYTVSNATKRILRDLDDIVNIKAYFSKELPPETHITVNAVRDLLNEYKSIAGGKLRVTWEDPAGNPEAEASARSLNVPEITLQTFKKDKAQAMKGYMGIGVMYSDRKESIPVVQNLATLEYDLTQAIMKVKRNSVPKVGILKTQTADFIPPEISSRMGMSEETTEKRFTPLFNSLRNDYQIVTVDVSEGIPIDSGIRTLIIPGGTHFTDRTLFEIDQYFMNGGNLIVLANAVGVSFQQGPQASVQESKILDLLEHYGVRVERNLIMDASCGHVQVPRNLGPFTINEMVPYPFFIRVVENGFDKTNPAVSDQSELILAWASSLTHKESIGNVSASALVTSSEQAWGVSEHFDINPKPDYNIPNNLNSHILASHLSGQFKSFFDGMPVPPVREQETDENNMSQIKLTPSDPDRAVKTSNTNGQLVVVGDANFVTAQNATRSNIIFMLNMVDWLSLDNNLIAVRSRVLKDKTINANVLEEGSRKPDIIRFTNILAMPVIVACAGIAISLRRRERISDTAATVKKEGTQS
ncbi:MAG: GldG family protein [Chitinispirillales bacterium]|jgi:gliding-associated putative ABC transporter substrate-binding component GldG|nr:GldG family protein [Chitinispirillales bacterium]